MGDLASVIAGEAANALREIGALAGVPSTVDVLLHLPDLVDWVRATTERAETVRVVTADRDVMRHELGRLQSMLALDAPYAVHDVLTRLADAADHLHEDHNCDCDGWEMTRAAAASARRIVAALVDYKPPDRDAETGARIADAVAAERAAAAAWVREWDPRLGQIASHIEDGRHINDDAPPLPSLRLTLAARRLVLEQLTASEDETKALRAERDELRAEIDKRTAPHCQHAMDPGHDMLGHGVHPDRGGPSVMDAEIERLTARVLELEAPGECQSLHKLRAERDRRIDPVEHARAVLAAFKDGEDDVKAAYAMEQANGWEMTRAALLARVGADVLAEVEDG